ncbi:VWA domain-containing protein [Streptomyces sp. 4N509B]|uniref:VWA domain-containing protein n=1 Tax=Streptomyces sp. 4N509B TaxID=3457413 RepID=UPI003FD22DB3
MTDQGRPTGRWHGPRGGTDAAAGPGVSLSVDQTPTRRVGEAVDGVHAQFTLRTHGLGPTTPLAAPARGAGAGAPRRPAATAQVVVIDCSDSMGYPESRFDSVRQAASRAVGLLPHGTRFAVVRGTHRATMVYPGTEELAVAGPDTLGNARSGIGRLYASGGTAVSEWLGLTRRLLAGSSAEIRQALLLTDGRNEEEPELLPAELARCRGVVRCDVWGIGEDLDREVLEQIAVRLEGRPDIALDGAGLAAGFEETMRAAVARLVPSLRIRIALEPGTRLRYLFQTVPDERELTAVSRTVVEGGRVRVEFPTSAWSGDEQREYHLCLDATPPPHAGEANARRAADGTNATEGREGTETDLAVAEVVVPPELGGPPAPVTLRVRWIPGARPVTEYGEDPRPEHLRRHQDLGTAIVRGDAAFRDGDRATAESMFRRAVDLAGLLGDSEMLAMLAEVMDLDEADDSGPRLKKSFDTRRLDRLWMRRNRTTPTPRPAPRGPTPGPSPVVAPAHHHGGVVPGEPRACGAADCERLSAPDARYCQECGTEFAS